VRHPGAMATNWGSWSAEERSGDDQPPAPAPQDALAPETVADFIAFIAGASPELVLTEAVVAPLLEQGWP